MIERLSERVGPTGSLQGEGLANLLGRPPFDPLTLALREAGQNIWDARDRGGETKSIRIPRMLVRIRHLTDTQSNFLKKMLGSGDESDDESSTTNVLHKHLAQGGSIPVLEICDFRTGGLSGPVDPQFAVGNFVRFFFDIGTAHFDGGDGGTYGYGRSSLYLAGASRTILVDTLLPGPRGARRFMGSRIGDSYQREVDGCKRRYTGRHFWGQVKGEGRVLPVEGTAAEEIALTLGMPRRGEQDTGTTILIPWPQLEEANAGQRVADILLHNLWPKLVSATGARAMEIAVEEHGIPVAIQDPKKHPRYSLLSQALLSARTRRDELGAKAISVLRSSKITGHISFARAAQTHQLKIESDCEGRPEKLFESTIRHVALMRPSELVVRYLEFPGIADTNSWAGVFLCSEDEEITRAFASSEPPAHDDWVPDRLLGTSATLVRVTKNKRIPDAVREYFGCNPGTHDDVGGSTASLAGASDRFAHQFLAGDGSGVGYTERGGGGGVSGGRGAILRTLIFLGLSQFKGRKLARFRTSLMAENPIWVQGSVAIDGADDVELLPDDLKMPLVLGWRHEDGSYTEGTTCLFQPGENYVMEVEFRGVYSILANCYLIRT